MKYNEVQKCNSGEWIRESIYIPGQITISKNIREVLHTWHYYDEGILVKNQYGEHFVFAFDTDPQCSETFYYDTVTDQKFPVHLRHGARIVFCNVEERFIQIPNLDDSERKFILDEGICVKIFSTRGTEPVAVIWCANDHNGYYAHSVLYQCGKWNYETEL